MTGRKLLSELTPDDLRAHPRWVFLPNDGDESWVVPMTSSPGERDSYIAAARATLGDGRECAAFVGVARLGKQTVTAMVTVFAGSSQLPIDASNPAIRFTPSRDELPVLPVRWVCTECLPGETTLRSGSASASWLDRFIKRLRYESQMGAAQRHSYK